jgi:hypothetical protein
LRAKLRIAKWEAKFLSLKILAIGRRERERERERETEREEREKKREEVKTRGEMDGCCCAAKEDVRINGCLSSSYIRRIAIEPLCNLVVCFFYTIFFNENLAKFNPEN